MENESCSWVTRAKFSATTYVRSSSSGLPSIRYDSQSKSGFDLKQESLSTELRPNERGLGSLGAPLRPDSNLQLRSKSSVSEVKQKRPILDSSSASYTTKSDGKMENESYSWVTRTKFSATTHVRSSSSGLPSIRYDSHSKSGFDLRQESLSTELKPKEHGLGSLGAPLRPDSNLQLRSMSYVSEVKQKRPILDSSSASYTTKSDGKSDSKLKDSGLSSSGSSSDMEKKSKPKQISVSPLPTTILSDVFKESRPISRRSSALPHRNEPEKNDWGPFQLFSSRKGFAKSRPKKESPWASYFDNGGGRVTAVETTEKWTVDLSELYFGARFASGAHSRLYHGLYKGQSVAVKIIRLPDDDENGVMAACLEKEFIRETTFLSHISHRNVIKLAGACKKYPVFFIITEYLSGGSLRSFLHKLDHKSIPLNKLIPIALDVARGMEYIHSQGVIHRDLKPENILFDENFCIKIADFGVACEEVYCDVLGDDAGTYRWMAPEMIKHKPYGRKVDVYSFGLLLWEMVTGAIPYEDMTPVQAAFAVVNKNMRPIIPSDCPVALRVLIEQCWSSLPEKRPEFWQIVKVLEQFDESTLAREETLNQVKKMISKGHKKLLLNWIEKLRPSIGDGSRAPAHKRL